MFWSCEASSQLIATLSDISVQSKEKFRDFMIIIGHNILRRQQALQEVLADFSIRYHLKMSEQLKLSLDIVTGSLEALRVNDNQSLYALVSRGMSFIHLRLGRQSGVTGFITNDLLTRSEKAITQQLIWQKLRSKVYKMVKFIDKMTSISITPLHDTGFRAQLSPPKHLWKDLLMIYNEIKLLQRKFPSHLKKFLSKWKSKIKYLVSWHIEGSAVVFGWDRAISWDGRLLNPILSDTCPHLLSMLTRSEEPTAITLQVVEDGEFHKKVLNFIVGSQVVSVDSDLKVTVNGALVRQKESKTGSLRITWSWEEVRVTSSNGLSLQCLRTKDICTISADARNFASTAGLLGVFDTESNTDFLTSTWDQAASTMEWASSWRVSMDECLRTPSVVPPEDFLFEENVCEGLFSAPQSPFKACLHLVPGRSYEDVCHSGWTCAAQEAFLQRCRKYKYDDLKSNLTFCDDCVAPVQEIWDLEDIPEEIVFIGDFSCVNNINSLVAFLKKNAKGGIQLTFRNKDTANPSFEIPEEIDQVVYSLNDAHLLELLSTSVDVDFSFDSLKAIVLFDCEGNCQSEKASSELSNHLRHILRTRGVQLYLITDEALVISNPDKVNKKHRKQMLGIDRRTVYLMSHARKKNLKGKRKMRKYVDIPDNNICADLAMQSDGAIFSTSALRKYKKAQHKRLFGELLAQRIFEGHTKDYFECRLCPCNSPCSLCRTAPFYDSKIFEDDPLEDEEYDDLEEIFTKSLLWKGR